MSPWSVLPLCGISKEEADAGNMTKISATSAHQATPRSLEMTSTVDKDVSQVHERTPSAKHGISDISSDSGLEKRHDYALDCSRGDDGSWQAYCIQSPRRYYCSTAGRVSHQVYDLICKQNCACLNLGPPKPCYVSPFTPLPLCGISKDEAEARNLTLIDPTSTTPVNTTSTSPGHFDNNSPVRREAPTSGSIELAKRHDYALDCTASGNKAWQSYCTKSPRKYYCSSLGQVKSHKDSATCDMECTCVDIGVSNPCYVSPWSILPLCGISKDEAKAQNLTLVNTTATSPGHFENNSPVERHAQLLDQDESANAEGEEELHGE